jgi:hypothetical protein
MDEYSGNAYRIKARPSIYEMGATRCIFGDFYRLSGSGDIREYQPYTHGG